MKNNLSRTGLSDPGAGGDRRERGYCVLGKRTWLRVRREFEGGASVAWLSARYGPGQRTIAAHAKAEGWRRKDLAARADAALDATEGVATPPLAVLPPLIPEPMTGPAASAAVADGADDGAELALNGAVMALRAGRIGEALAYAKLAEAMGRARRGVASSSMSEDGSDAGAARGGVLDETVFAAIRALLPAEVEDAAGEEA